MTTFQTKSNESFDNGAPCIRFFIFTDVVSVPGTRTPVRPRKNRYKFSFRKKGRSADIRAWPSKISNQSIDTGGGIEVDESRDAAAAIRSPTVPHTCATRCLSSSISKVSKHATYWFHSVRFPPSATIVRNRKRPLRRTKVDTASKASLSARGRAVNVSNPCSKQFFSKFQTPCCFNKGLGLVPSVF